MIGENVAHFTILEKLGSGGMGVVYKARDTRLQSIVALKFVSPELTRDATARERLLREAQALAAIDHPNICTIHSVHDTPDGGVFFCMAYYEGETVHGMVNRGPLAVPEALHIAHAAARGLAKAHGAGVIHRDIKPGNIIVTRDGTVKILDFGVAKVTDRTAVTQQGMTPGTTFYMSPEQLSGRDVDERTDFFSLGVVLYEMLTGHLPFEADNMHAVSYRILHEPAEPLSRYMKDVPRGLQRILDRLLAKDPENRFRHMAELQHEIEWVMGRGARHRRLRVAVVAVVIAAAVSTVGWQVRERFMSGQRTETRLVLAPLTSTSPAQSDRVMLDGLREVLIYQLSLAEASSPSFWVLPAADTRRHDGDPPGNTDRVLGVNRILQGNLHRSGNTMRLDLSLLDADHQHTLKRVSLTTDLSRLADWQSGLVTAVADLLGVTMADSVKALIAAGGTHSPDAYVKYLEGCARLAQPDSETVAASSFEAALKLDPRYGLAHAALAQACAIGARKSGDVKCAPQAIEHCQKAIAADSLDVAAYLSLGDVCMVTAEYPRAVTVFRHALSIAPTDETYRKLAEAYQSMQNMEGAEAAYRAVADHSPDFWPARRDLGLFYYGLGRYADAAAQFERIVKLTPRSPSLYNSLGAFYYYQDRMDDARKMWETSFGIQKTYGACSNLGTLYYRAKRYEDALRMYQWAVEFDQAASDYIAWGNLGQAYARFPDQREKVRKNYMKAIDLAEQASKEDPTDPTPLAYLAGYYADIGDTTQSIERIDEAVRLAPHNGDVLFRAGHAYAKLGNVGHALIWLGRALDNGYPKEEILDDPELENLRHDPRFRHLITPDA